MLIENIFLALFKSSNFYRIAYPHIKSEYFPDKVDKKLFDTIKEYETKFNKQGTVTDIKLLLDTNLEITEDETSAVFDKIKTVLQIDEVTDETLLIEKTEEWCKNRALELAILDSVEIIQNNEKNKGVIEEKIKEALSVQFDVNIGHDYYNDAKERLKWYYDEEENIALDIDELNKAMGGGLKRKAIAVFIAPPKRGKSLWMTHCAASLIRTGKNVLYLSCELSEKMVTKRIDANILDIPMDELSPKLDKNVFKSKFKKICEKSHGKLIIKETPNLNSLQVKYLLHELRQKKNFVPDVVIIDYINICSSSTLNSSHVGNSNLYIGKIVMEMRNLAVAENLAILSAVQNNRGGVKKSVDTGMDDIADAFSIAMNVDWGGAIIQSDELRNQNKYLLKTVLTRWDGNTNDIGTIGVQYDKMKLVNVDASQYEIPQHVKDNLKYQAEKETKVVFDFDE